MCGCVLWDSSGLLGAFGPAGDRRSGMLGRRSQFAARPTGGSDLNCWLEQAGAPAPCQIPIPKPALLWGRVRSHIARAIWDTHGPANQLVIQRVVNEVPEARTDGTVAHALSLGHMAKEVGPDGRQEYMGDPTSAAHSELGSDEVSQEAVDAHVVD